MPEVTLDLEALTLNEKEAESSIEIIQQEFEKIPEIAEMHEIITGIQYDTFIPFAGEISEELGQCLANAGCTVPEEEGTIVFSQKKAAPKKIGTRLKHCMESTLALFKAFKKKLPFLNHWDGTGSEELAFIEDRALQSLKKMVMRYAHFGDTAIDNVEDDGILSNDLDVTKFNCIDGFWKQIFDGVTANKILRIVIPENQGASYEEQSALDAERTLLVMREMYNRSDATLMATPGLTYCMTRSMFNNWVDFRESKGFDTFATANESVMTSVNQYRGIPIKVINYWDVSIKKFFNDGVKLDKPHRVWLTVKSNVPLITSDEYSLGNIRSFYVEKDLANYVDMNFKLDAKVLQETLITVAY